MGSEVASAHAGLDAAEASRRLAAEGPNELPAARARGFLRQVAGVVAEPMILLLVAAGTVNLFLAERLDAILLTATVLVIVGISIFQERKTENALAALRDLSAPRALVVRGGERLRIPGREVVRGDLVVLVEGDRVPADAVVVEASGLSVDESLLTGESVPVRKIGAADTGAQTGAHQVTTTPTRGTFRHPAVTGGSVLVPPAPTPWVYSGTLVVKGRGLAVVAATGGATELGRIGAALGEIEEERTPLQREVARIVRVIAVLGLGAAAAVVVIYGATRGDWPQGVLAGIATAMAMLPEEFPVVLTVFLALGAWRMSRGNVLARRSAVIETLGSVTVLCVDKTGTLTMNAMVVGELIVDGERFVLDGGGVPERFRDLVESAVLASPPQPIDPMDRAFRDLGERHLGPAHEGWELLREYPLSEDLLAVSHAWRVPGEPDAVLAAKGAPEAIGRLCRFDADGMAALTRQVDAATAAGQRVLAVARARHAGPLPEEQREVAFEYLGLAGLYDPVRPGVPEAVAECARAGIRTVMITGDFPGTALAIARAIGLDHAGGCITGPELEAMDDAHLARRIPTVSVFARVVPQQKLRIVRALKANGEVVGMTGDGVNDAPALRAADVGIALGGRGTDVAREAAALVITDDDFTSIARGVRQGRAIYDNLRKAMTYLIAVHVAIFGASLVPVLVAAWPLVLLPLQIAFLEFIIDPACSIVFESEGADPLVMERPPRRAGAPIFDRRGAAVAVLQGLGSLAAVLAVFLWTLATGRTPETVRTAAFVTIVLGNLALILVNRSGSLPVIRAMRERRNPTVVWIVAGTLALLLLVTLLPGAREAFRLGPLAPAEWAVAVLAAAAGAAGYEVDKLRRARRRP